MLPKIQQYITDVYHLGFPNNCLLCRKSLTKAEKDLCFYCIESLPYTNQLAEAENPVAQRFWGRLSLESAAAFLYVNKTNQVHSLMHLLKYKNKKRIGVKLGRLMGFEFKKANSIFQNIDLIVPLPLHWKKEKQRGYNQCDFIAEGLAAVTEIPWNNKVVAREKENISQTKKSKYERWENVEGIFSVKNPSAMEGKSILLIDDVVTTGSTLEACAHTILQVPDVKLSVLAVATAGR
jgi:ComF family protein